MSKQDLCPKCGMDRNYAHERDGTYMCWCSDDAADDDAAPQSQLKQPNGKEVMFLVRVVDVNQQTVVVTCEACGFDLPIDTLTLINADAAGVVMLGHARTAHPLAGVST